MGKNYVFVDDLSPQDIEADVASQKLRLRRGEGTTPVRGVDQLLVRQDGELFEVTFDSIFAHVAGMMTDVLMDLTDAPITLAPRFTDVAQAAAFDFMTAEDYAPAGSFVDLATTLPGRSIGNSEPAPRNAQNKCSVYLCAGVGNNPQSNPKSQTRVAILFNQIGAYHGWITTYNPTPNFNEPRTLFAHTRNMELRGISYGVSHYDDWFEIAHNENNPTGIGLSHVRIINLGTEPLHVKSLIIQRYAGG